jgi:hypothetical protein
MMSAPAGPTAGATVQSLLAAKFQIKRVVPVIKHFQESVNEAQLGDWEASLLKSGKFVEAVLKLLWDHVGNVVPKSKDFKAGQIITDLERMETTRADDTIRVTIPRACRFIYEIASNRGARHDPDEINPNQMDASAVSALIAWVVAELVRYAQKGVVDLDEATRLVAGLSQKRYQVVEEVGDRVYFHLKSLSARDVALLILWYAHPRRVFKGDLIDGIKRHGSSEANAKMGISRLRVVDVDGAGNYLLLAPGILEAEKLLAPSGTLV